MVGICFLCGVLGWHGGGEDSSVGQEFFPQMEGG